MKRALLYFFSALSLLLLAGCTPADSIFPLHNSSDKNLDDRLLGEWRELPTEQIVDGKTIKSTPDADTRWVIRKTKDSDSYDFTVISLTERGSIRATARLVSLEGALFLDFEPNSRHDDNDNGDLAFLAVSAHALARVEIGKKHLSIRFMDEDWVDKQAKAGTLNLAHLNAPSGVLLTATTEDLRNFAAAHKDDPEAFSLEFKLARVK